MSTTGKGARWSLIRDSVTLSENPASARAEAGDLATRLLVKLGISKPPIHLEDLAVYLRVSLNLSVTTPEYAYENAMDTRLENETKLWANQDLSWEAKRMAHAHAMGHLLLHSIPDGKVRTCTWHENMDDRLELEANAFARSLLMPLWMVEREWCTGTYGSVGKLAQAFQVYEKDMVRRLELLKD